MGLEVKCLENEGMYFERDFSDDLQLEKISEEMENQSKRYKREFFEESEAKLL